MEYQNFLDECKRFLKYVNETEASQRRCDVGLHGRKATWSLDFAEDALGSRQPFLVGKYTVKAMMNPIIKSPFLISNDNKKEIENDKDEDDDEDEEDPNAAPPNSQMSQGEARNIKTLQITLYVTYNQPYGVPSLDFVACDLETGRPICDVDELLSMWLPNLLDAFALDTQAAKEFEERINKSDQHADDGVAVEEKINDGMDGVFGVRNNTILKPALVPRISRSIHELLNVPVFSVHACDTVGYFKMMKVAMMVERSHTQQQQQQQNVATEFSQSPIDVVLALYGKFIGLLE